MNAPKVYESRETRKSSACRDTGREAASRLKKAAAAEPAGEEEGTPRQMRTRPMRWLNDADGCSAAPMSYHQMQRQKRKRRRGRCQRKEDTIHDDEKRRQTMKEESHEQAPFGYFD